MPAYAWAAGFSAEYNHLDIILTDELAAAYTESYISIEYANKRDNQLLFVVSFFGAKRSPSGDKQNQRLR